jgi:drug/metabolite transporter (DMT)-like permease
LSGVLLALLAALLWSIASVMLTVAARRIHVLPLNLVRCATAALFFWVLLPWFGGLDALGGIAGLAWLWLVVSVLANLVVGDTLYFGAMHLAGVSWAMPVAAINPLWSVLLAAAFLDEPLSWGLVGGALLVVAGVVCISRTTDQDSRGSSGDRGRWRKGMLLALATSILWAIGNVTIKLAATGVEAVVVSAARQLLAAGLLFSACLPRGRWREPKGLDGRSWAILLFASLLGTGVGALLWVMSIQQIGAGRSSILIATAPMLAIPFSVLWLGERPTRWTILGTVLTAAGIVLVV